jgi:hypothetical protein
MNTITTILLKTTLSISLLLPLSTLTSASTPQKWKLDTPKTKVDFKVAYLGNGTLKSTLVFGVSNFHFCGVEADVSVDKGSSRLILKVVLSKIVVMVFIHMIRQTVFKKQI